MTEPAPPHRQPEENPRHGRLRARPAPPVVQGATGLARFTAPDGEPLALAYAPAEGDGPYRLVLLLHGAGGSARQGLDLLLPLADAHRLLLLAPQATASSWDLIVEGFGPDVGRIDELLDTIFGAYPVDGVVVGGFSDGASYALSLGLTNGDLFDAVLAFSPGFAAPLVTHGRPRAFVSHGTDDRVLPVDMCSRRLVPRLHSLGYAVEYAEFTGGHEVPAEIRQRAVEWLTG
ncbi:Predicted esterase [Micromonospora rhizosphaerae]|uniref:Predicted esterase n=1 Tax=Micromonospora rhizosphaerae TaxID=568872 RepID=A0A1C6SVE8_9ACTN|nr:alpha/beta hydrolase-fold protein [Micromonospora rhizosphaerae]SCL33614.1 Predicted esterase [Micromonospora rhizosphaerae]